MHGRKREEYKTRFKNPKVAAGLAHKAQQWYALCHELSERRKSQQEAALHDDTDKRNEQLSTTLRLIEKALLVNPDPSHIWNHRRQTLLQLPPSTIALSSELQLTQAALQRGNPKAYAAWFHRKWTILQQFVNIDSTALFQDATPLTVTLQQEVTLTAEFLGMDERNFHCWNYRRFLVAAIGHSIIVEGLDDTMPEAGKLSLDGSWYFLKYLDDTNSDHSASPPPAGIHLNSKMVGAQLGKTSQKQTNNVSPASIDDEKKEKLWKLIESEWNFAAKKISDNFSNGSAFFYRSQLLPFIFRHRLHTNPDSMNDMLEEEFQLIENAMCTEPDDQTAWWYHAFLLKWIPDKASIHARLSEQTDLLRELLEEVPNNKWVLLGIHRILHTMGEGVDEQQTILTQLQSIDPDRAKRY